MATHIPSLVEVISELHPEIGVEAVGDGNDYAALVSAQELPSLETLEAERLTLLRRNMWRDIQADRDLRKASGVKVGTNWYHSDDTSRIQQIGLVMFGANMPPGIMWKTMQGTFVQMTPTLATQIFQSIAGQDQAIFARAEQHRAAMNASATPETYDYSGGWPQTFSEAYPS